MRFILGFGLALAGAAVCGFVSYRVACRAVGMEARASVRFAAAGIAAVWMLVAMFWALAPFGLFRAPVVAALWALAGIAAWRAGDRNVIRARFEADTAAVRGAFASLGVDRWERWLLAAVGVLFTLYLLRGLVAPPLAWDSLTYHLVHAGRYVQTGGLGREAAPDAWGYYEYFPAAGEVLWAWAMLGPRSDVLLAPAGVAVALLGGLGVYAAARELEAPVRTAALAAFAFLASPVVSMFLTSAYVDTVVASLFALGCVFLFRALRAPRVADVALAMAAFGVGVGTKYSMLPIAGLAAVLLAVAAVAAVARRPRSLVMLGFLPGLVGACHYARAWIETGNPLYPMSLEIFGRRLAGNPQLEWVLGPARFASDAPRSAWTLFSGMFMGNGVSSSNHLNLGPGGLLLLAGAAAGALVLVRRRRGEVLFLLGTLVVNVALLMGPGAAALRHVWWWASGRHLGPALVAVVLLAAGVPGRAGRALLALSIAGSLAVALPWGFGLPGWWQALAGAVAVGVAAGLAVLIWRIPRLRAAAPWLAAAVGLTVLAAGLHELRARARHETWEAALQLETYDVHGLPAPSAAHALWRRLDDGRPRTVATTAGFVRNGHNWLRYPLMGSSLQNRLIYVPVTRDGSVIDYREGKADAFADRAAWLARLDALGVDAVVVMAPVTCPEHAWIVADRERFEVIPARGGADLRDGYMARVRRESLPAGSLYKKLQTGGTP